MAASSNARSSAEETPPVFAASAVARTAASIIRRVDQSSSSSETRGSRLSSSVVTARVERFVTFVESSVFAETVARESSEAAAMSSGTLRMA